MARAANTFDGVRFLAALKEVVESARRATPCERTGKEGTILAVNPNGEGRWCPIRWRIKTDGKIHGSGPVTDPTTKWYCRVELILNQDRWYDPKPPKARPPAISDKQVLEWLRKNEYPFGFLRQLRNLTPSDRMSNLYGMDVPIYR